MFEPQKSPGLELIDYWYVLLPDFHVSTEEFYDAVSSELVERKVPETEISRVELPEGGAISARREYLQVQRERFGFLVCSAPFGTSWFFSCRFAKDASSVRLWAILLAIFLAYGWFRLHMSVFGAEWGIGIAAVGVAAAFFLFNTFKVTAFQSLDSALLKIPIIGRIYELYLRPNTYFREDCRLVYTELVDRVVRGKVTEFSGADDVTKVEFQVVPKPERQSLWERIKEWFRNSI